MEAQASDSYPAAAIHIATVLWKHRLVTATYPAAADHSNSAMEAQASDSPAAAYHTNSAMEAQASDSYPAAAAADHSNSAMEVQASDSYPAAADHIATVLCKHRLVTAIQQQQII